jgi:hypothetical protein
MAEVEALVRRFQDRTLPRPEWTHHAHLTVAFWYLSRTPEAEALGLIRDGIQAYNAAVGVPTTPTGGYHETITRFYVWLVHDYLERAGNAEAPLVLLNALLATRGDKSLPLRYYSRERLMSPEARYGWLEPDLEPLDRTF